MSYREPSKPAAPEPRVSGGAAAVITIVVALGVLCLLVMWLSATHGG